MKRIIPLVFDIMLSIAGLITSQKYEEKKRKVMEELLQSFSSPPVIEVSMEPTQELSLYNSGGGNMGEEPCEICSIKHLLSGKTFLIEGKSRSGDEKQRKVMEAYRELQAAEQHLVERHPELASEVRSLRKRIEACAFTGDLCEDIDITEIDIMIKKIVPHVPREHYFKPIEQVEE